MATTQFADVHIRNDSGGNATIHLFHSNSSNGTQRATWAASPGESVGPLAVYFETGHGTGATLDYWSALIHVKDGPNAGFYGSAGSMLFPYWTECQLQTTDAQKDLRFRIDTKYLHIALASGGCAGAMTKLTPRSPITHVFVVMLENHSFDNMLAMSGIPGIAAATTRDSNSFDDDTFHVQPSAPLSMTSDPGHEFLDVVEQLAGEGATYPRQGPYPPIDNSGFVANYATSTSEGPVPAPEHRGDVMACFATPSQLPVLQQLATEFAVCDHWFSSLPGPTWPNRFFLHGASSAGMDDSPSSTDMERWEIPGFGFRYPHGSIFDALGKAGTPYRLYHDASPSYLSMYSDDPQRGSMLGAVPQVTSLRGVTLLDFESLGSFAADLDGPYPYPYTFIEPHYGDITGGSYAGGSSQHPMDDVYGGEHLLAGVYSAIRNSPYWDTSLLIVTYDEHGGMYDSVAPGTVPSPADGSGHEYNKHGFDFTRYGVRVPGIAVSPLIPKGTVDQTVYDHASVLKTIEQLFGLPALTRRDALANSLVPLLSLSTPRTDCPSVLARPAPLGPARRVPMTEEERTARDAQPVPRAGNMAGALWNLLKAEVEMSGEVAASQARYQAVQTRGDARVYAESVLEKVRAVRRVRKAAGGPAPGT